MGPHEEEVKDPYRPKSPQSTQTRIEQGGRIKTENKNQVNLRGEKN